MQHGWDPSGAQGAKKNNTAPLIIGLVFLVAIVGGGIYFLTQGDDDGGGSSSLQGGSPADTILAIDSALRDGDCSTAAEYFSSNIHDAIDYVAECERSLPWDVSDLTASAEVVSEEGNNATVQVTDNDGYEWLAYLVMEDGIWKFDDDNS